MTDNTDRTKYKLDNTYLTQDEKISVESWYQLPGDVMEYVFWAIALLSIFYPISLIYIISIPIIINLIAGLINWYFYKEKLTRILGLSLFHPFVMGAIGIGVGVFLLIKGALLLAVVSAFVGIFSFLFLELHIFLYSLLALKSKMHPKYLYAKKQFGRTFPFENIGKE